MKIKFLFFVFLLISTLTFAQKKSIDENSYREWRRIDSYSLSQNGRWVIYKYTFLDNEEKNKEIKNRFYLFDNTTKKTEVMDSISNPVFCGNGGWLMYNQSTLLRLKDKKKIEWKRETFPQFGESDELVSYACDNRKNVVLLNLNNGDSLVYKNVLHHCFYDDFKKIVFLVEEDKCVKLMDGTVQKKSNFRTLFSDSTKMLHRFNFNTAKHNGTFEIGSQYYSFSTNDNNVTLDFDATVLGNAASVHLLKNPNLVAFDVFDKVQKKKTYDIPNDTSFTFELWSWNDEEVPSVQAKGFREKELNPLKYIYNKSTGKHYQVSDEHYTSVYFSDSENCTFAFKCDEEPYSMNRDWEHDARMDVYAINLLTGENTLIIKGTTHRPKWSPDGHFIVYFNSVDRNWFSYEPNSKKNVNLTAKIGYPVYNEEYDRPNPAGSYGWVGCTNDDKSIVIYDKYDLWVVDVQGVAEPYCMTNGYGRKNDAVVRLFNPNSVPLKIDLHSNQEVEVVRQKSMHKGFYTLTPKGKMIRNFEGPYAIKVNKVSDNSDIYLYQRQSFNDDRDLWISDSKFKNCYKITNANPQQKEYKWGRVELFEWKNYDGKQNKGLLFLPENYKKGESFPTIVSFYETHTDKRYIYQAPSLSSAMIDIATYVSNGYIVFQPDVNFTIGEPGQSSYNAVVSGTKALIDEGIIDENRVGLQGHSWSGYQVAYLVTKTDLFKCVNIGAAVVNMTSSYNGIREGSGMPRMFMYEDWQCRMGKTLWEDKKGYIENSPIFFAENINTPVLLFHCDNDEAVSFSEGRSLFLALRRLGKPAWMLNYMGEGHFLSLRPARVDWTIRVRQFYDYYLKNSDIPRWMDEGITIHERGFDKKYNLIKK